jgi:hypothetical protein
MDSEKFYRVVTREVFERVPFGGLIGPPETQRQRIDGEYYIVERAPGFDVNDRWLTNEEAKELVAGPDWTDPNPFPQYVEA